VAQPAEPDVTTWQTRLVQTCAPVVQGGAIHHPADSPCVWKPPESPPEEGPQMDTRTAQQVLGELCCWRDHDGPSYWENVATYTHRVCTHWLAGRYFLSDSRRWDKHYGSQSSKERKFQGAKVSKNFRSRERKGRAISLQGAKWPGSKRAKEWKGQGANWPGSYLEMHR